MKKIFSLLLAFVLAMGSPPSFAGYAQLKPPAGWSQGMGAAVPGQAGVFAFGPAANGASFRGGTVLTNAALSVAGQYVVVPASMRLAANAATVAAEWSFGNPYLFAAALAAPIAYNFYKSKGAEVIDNQWMKNDPDACASNCKQYQMAYMSGWHNSPTAAAGEWIAANDFSDSSASYKHTVNSCGASSCSIKQTITQPGPPVSTSSSNVTVAFSTRPSAPRPPKKIPISKEDYHRIFDPLPMPNGMPQELPVPLPVMPPVINPDPAIEPQPSPAPLQDPRPLWVPTGDPVKNPSSPGQPDTWTQPGVRVTPSPTTTDPWRVDVNPEPLTKNNPTPNTQPVTVTPPDPSTPTTPGEPIDIETCGLPGKPACLIDEKDTPPEVAEDVYTPKLEDYRTKQGELKDAVAGTDDKSFFDGWGDIFVTPPMAACTGYILPRDMGTIDPCPVVDGVRTIMAYIWALTALFLAVGMVKKVV